MMANVYFGLTSLFEKIAICTQMLSLPHDKNLVAAIYLVTTRPHIFGLVFWANNSRDTHKTFLTDYLYFR